MNKPFIIAVVVGLVVVLGTPSRAELVGYWSFDNDDLVESSGYAQSADGGSNPAGYHDGIVGTGSVAYIDGPSGRALDLSGGDGTNAVVVSNSYQDGGTFSFEHNVVATNVTPQTIALWVKGWPTSDLDSRGTWYGSFIDKCSQNGSFRLGAVDANNAGYRFTDRQLSGAGSSDLTDGEWHHIVGTYTNSAATPQLRLYVDGELADSGDFNVKYHHTYNLVFGARDTERDNAPYTLADFSQVQLDEIGIFKSALSAINIAVIHAMGRFEGIGLMDVGITDLVGAFETTGSAAVNNHIWEYTDLSGESTTVGATGGTVAGGDAWVVLDSSGNGMQYVPGLAGATVIYYDNFSGTVTNALNATAPDIRPAAETWTASTLMNSGPTTPNTQYMIASDGSVGGTINDGGDSSANSAYSAWLPFTPVAGEIYELTATMTPRQSWGYQTELALGFADQNGVGALGSADPGGYGWMYFDTTGTADTDANIYTVPGVQGNGEAAAGAAFQDLPCGVARKVKIVFDTSEPSSASWTMAWYYDANSDGDFDDAGDIVKAATTASSGDYGNISYVGYGTDVNRTRGLIDDFKLISLPTAGGTVFRFR